MVFGILNISHYVYEQLEAAKKRLEEANKEQEALVDIFAEERSRRDKEEDNLRKNLRVRKIQGLLRIRQHHVSICVLLVYEF